MARYLSPRRRGLDVAEAAALPLPPLVALMRPDQWVKNLFVAAPLFFTPPAQSATNALAVLVGFFAFCCLASAVYVVNDYLDREADRRHPEKASRPLAAGTVSTAMAGALLASLLLAGLSLAFSQAPRFAAVAAIYLAINLAYSLWLKHVAIVDVLSIALSFVLRVMAGAALIGIEPSAWILIVSGLLALFMALGKRRDDLVKSLDGQHRRSLEGYTQPFLDAAVAVVLGALLVAYMVYTTDREVMAELGTRNLVYTVIFVIAGILRYLQVIFVEQRSGSPTAIALSDRFLITTIVLWALAFALLIH